MNRKRYFNETKKKYAQINYYQSCIIIFFDGSVLQRDLDEADHLQSLDTIFSHISEQSTTTCFNRLFS